MNGLLSQVTQLESENDQLRRENIVPRQENIDLRNRLDKDSKNSHKPPSSDGYSKKPALPKSERGQTGHQSKSKTLEMVSNPDTIIEYYAQVCHSCKSILTSDNIVKLGSSDQIFDLHKTKIMA